MHTASPGDAAVRNILTLENQTCIESLAVRSHGEVLCTLLKRAALHLLDPFAQNAFVVHQFERTDNASGFKEIGNDILAVVVANIFLQTGMTWPESAKI
jgi:hypothetical protein